MQHELLLTVLLAATALLTGATLYLSFLHSTGRKAQPVDPGLPYQKAQQLLDELLVDAPWSITLSKPRPTEEKRVLKEIDEGSRQAGERINRLFEGTKGVNEHFGVFGGARPPESRDRKGRRP
jgi:hypothetical protein